MGHQQQTQGTHRRKWVFQAIIPAIWLAFSVFIIWILLQLLGSMRGKPFD